MNTIEYTVSVIDGDYAYLKNDYDDSAELKCVARALLPPEVNVGTRLRYEKFEYTVI